MTTAVKRLALVNTYILDNAEEIYVGVVDGKVDEKRSSASVQPAILLEGTDDVEAVSFGHLQVLNISAPTVSRDFAPVGLSIQGIRRLVLPTELRLSY